MAIAAGPKRIRMPLEQFEHLPEGPPFYDYINGEAIELNRPSARHQDIVVCLAYTLRVHCRQSGLGIVAADVDVRLPTGDWVGPDISYLAPERADLLDNEKGDILGAPTLVVEVLSPSTVMYDRIEKLALYERAQVSWVWFVDQDTLAIEEFQWTADGYLRIGGVRGGQQLSPRAFPTLTIDLAVMME